MLPIQSLRIYSSDKGIGGSEASWQLEEEEQDGENEVDSTSDMGVIYRAQCTWSCIGLKSVFKSIVVALKSLLNFQ